MRLTYSTSSRHGGQAKAGSAAPIAHTVFCKWSVGSRHCYSFSQATRPPQDGLAVVSLLSTAIDLMHRKRLMMADIGDDTRHGDAQWLGI